MNRSLTPADTEGLLFQEIVPSLGKRLLILNLFAVRTVLKTAVQSYILLPYSFAQFTFAQNIFMLIYTEFERENMHCMAMKKSNLT